jgi:ABC-type lipoprotein export system ATPase subunit
MQCDENTGLPKPTIKKENGKWVKQVLFNSNGYVKPNEMVAILGPSGSGKTSLLNVISQRTGLSQSSYAKGKVYINNR